MELYLQIRDKKGIFSIIWKIIQSSLSRDKIKKVPYIRHFLCIYRLLCYQIDTNNIESMFLMRN